MTQALVQAKSVPYYLSNVIKNIFLTRCSIPESDRGRFYLIGYHEP